jgi:hypothetical protein
VNLVRGNSIILFAMLVLMDVVLFPMLGRAQQFISGEFKLSQEVRWENSVLPMGDYLYIVDSNESPAVVRVQQKGGSFSGVFIPQTFLRRDKLGNSGIDMASTGNETHVMSIHLRGLGGELVFSAPDTRTENQPADPIQTEGAAGSTVRTLEYLTILNPKHEKMSPEEAEKVYLRACEAVEKEFNRLLPVRPRLVLRLGAGDNVLRYPTHEIQLKKWDEYRFADAVVDLALYDMVPAEERVRLSNSAIHAAGATVNICELKACVN